MLWEKEVLLHSPTHYVMVHSENAHHYIMFIYSANKDYLNTIISTSVIPSKLYKCGLDDQYQDKRQVFTWKGHAVFC